MGSGARGRTKRGNAARRAGWREEVARGWYRFRRSYLSLAGLGIVALVVATALLAPLLAPHPEDAGSVVRFTEAHQPPSIHHPFGTDQVGRDVFSRVLLGARSSVLMALGVLTLAAGIGVPLGLIAGYRGGLLGTVIMRLTDVFLAIPPEVLALAACVALTPSLHNAMLAVSFVWWPWYTRLVYGEVLSIREEQFVEASRGIGASPWRIMFRDVLPNCLSPILVKVTLDAGFVILLSAGLSFLGLGAQPPEPAWGTMIADGRVYMPDNWWLATFPGLAIFVTVLGLNLLGDGLRDVFDVELDRWGV